MTVSPDYVREFVARFDTRFEMLQSDLDEAIGDKDSQEFYDDVQLLMKLAVGHPLRPEDETRLVERGRRQKKMPDSTTPKRPMHFVSASCQGEFCAVHRNRAPLSVLSSRVPATHKVEETIFHDDPHPIRHPLVAYVCCECYKEIVGPAAPCP